MEVPEAVIDILTGVRNYLQVPESAHVHVWSGGGGWGVCAWVVVVLGE